jgi:hypothetical protein
MQRLYKKVFSVVFVSFAKTSELFQNRKLDKRDAGFSKLDIVSTSWDYTAMYLERPNANK